MMKVQFLNVILMNGGKISYQGEWLEDNPFRAIDNATTYAYRFNIAWDYAYTEVVYYHKIKSYSKRMVGATAEYRIETRDIR